MDKIDLKKSLHVFVIVVLLLILPFLPFLYGSIKEFIQFRVNLSRYEKTVLKDNTLTDWYEVKTTEDVIKLLERYIGDSKGIRDLLNGYEFDGIHTEINWNQNIYRGEYQMSFFRKFTVMLRNDRDEYLTINTLFIYPATEQSAGMHWYPQYLTISWTEDGERETVEYITTPNRLKSVEQYFED